MERPIVYVIAWGFAAFVVFGGYLLFFDDKRPNRDEHDEAWLFGIVVLLATVVGVGFNVWRGREYASHSASATGTVMSWDESTRSDSNGIGFTTVWAPVVAFNAPGGTYRFTSSRSDDNPPATSSQVTVRYDPDDPVSAHIAGWDRNTVFPWLVVLPVGLSGVWLLAAPRISAAVRARRQPG